MADDRAERAFARAFTEHADEHGFTPLDPEALAGLARDRVEEPAGALGGRGRRPWLALVAAAVVLVVGLPMAGVWLGQRGGGAVTAGAPAPVPAPPARDQSAAGPGMQAASGPEADARACPASLPDVGASPPSVEGAPTASEVVVCQYGAGGRALVGSSRLAGSDARRVLEALRAGRFASGVSLTCSPGTEAVLLRFDGGVREVRLVGAEATALVCG